MSGMLTAIHRISWPERAIPSSSGAKRNSVTKTRAAMTYIAPARDLDPELGVLRQNLAPERFGLGRVDDRLRADQGLGLVVHQRAPFPSERRAGGRDPARPNASRLRGVTTLSLPNV